MIYSRIILILGLLFLVAGVIEWVHPFGTPAMRANPILMVVVGALLVARHLAQETARKRRQMLDEVPDKPLGLD